MMTNVISLHKHLFLFLVSDKQDVLAMCALQFASKSEISTLEKGSDDTEAIHKLNELTSIITTHLE